jgi:hypothetical protein
MQQHPLGNNVSSWVIYPVACALVVIGAKWWMIAHYGSPTPFWDQWDAEGAILYPKYLSGTLQISDLIAPITSTVFSSLACGRCCCWSWEVIGIPSCKWWRTR